MDRKKFSELGIIMSLRASRGLDTSALLLKALTHCVMSGSYLINKDASGAAISAVTWKELDGKRFKQRYVDIIVRGGVLIRDADTVHIVIDVIAAAGYVGAVLSTASILKRRAHHIAVTRQASRTRVYSFARLIGDA